MNQFGFGLVNYLFRVVVIAITMKTNVYQLTNFYFCLLERDKIENSRHIPTKEKVTSHQYGFLTCWCVHRYVLLATRGFFRWSHNENWALRMLDTVITHTP